MGLAGAETVRLGMTDGEVRATPLTRALCGLAGPGDLILAPWSCDGHPDHDAAGEAAARAGRRVGALVYSYLVWAWHWAAESDLPWSRAVRVEMDAGLAESKRAAVRCFATQIGGPDPILPPAVLARLTRPFEVLVAP
jgi:LmbE family N-acetylglucosaminyl deacetylase